MAAVIHPFVVLGMVSTVAAIGIAAVAWYQRESPGAREYTIVMAVLAIWSTCYVLQLLQPTVSAKTPWLVARHAITPFIGVLFWIFAARYTDRPGLLSRRYLWPLVAVGTVSAVLVVSNPGSIYWTALRPAMTASLPVVDIDFGPAFWLNAGYTLGVVGGGHVFIVVMFRESLEVYRPQLTAMTVTGGIEFGLTAMFLSDHLAAFPSLNPWPHIQLITYGTTLAVIPIGWSYVTGALFKLQPLAERIVIENMDDAVFVFDSNDTLRYTNSAALRLLDPATAAAITGEAVETVFADYPELLAQYRRIPTDSTADPNTLQFVVDGERRYYDLRGSPITNSAGMTTGAVVVARDVTEPNRQRAELRERTDELEAKKAQLEQQNEQLDQFSSFVSHDLRSPLQVARGYLRLAEQTENLDHLAEVDDSLRRMDTMVEDLRELTRVDQRDLSTEPVAVESAARQAWGQVDTGTASLEVEHPGEVLADREFLLHVFENLFRNSVQHGSTSSRTQSGDREDRSSPGSRPAADDNGGGVTVRVGPLADGLFVEDDGPGVPAGERESILEHGYSTSSGGTGLGLSIVSTVVEAHGWTITVSESDDGGARFEFTGVDGTAETPPDVTRLPSE
ncbi:MAG: histidine kinase N-terminal 7TM domain-containing protein [Euryarchaeota archaeon]|nr:histidine kinase N-terminal 7TM domain-containing protein [Euryarchaeota archaeon]